MGLSNSPLLVWWASVGAEFHGSNWSWLFPKLQFPAVACTVIERTKEENHVNFTDPEIIYPVDYDTCLAELTDCLAQLVISAAQTVPDPVALVCANYLSYDNQFQSWVSEQSLFLPIFSAGMSPGISPSYVLHDFYVLHELDLQALLDGRGYFAGSNQWLETTLGVGFLIASRKNRIISHLLESQGICFAKDFSSESFIDFEALDWSEEIFSLTDQDRVKGELIRYVSCKALGEYQLLKPLEAMIVPYGHEVREQILFVHRHLCRDYMIRVVQAAFQLPLVVSWPSLEELKAWDWAWKLPKDLEWIINLRT